MAKYSIKLLPIALEDLKSIAAYIRLDNPDAAIAMVAKIRETVGKLADYPNLGVIPQDKVTAAQGYRMLVVSPYLVFYMIVAPDNVIEIHRVLHEKLDYPTVTKPIT